jgi:hypothetical protein
VRAQIELWGEVEDSESAPTLIAAFETDFDSP